MDLTKEGSKYIYKFTPSGAQTVEVIRSDKGYFTAYAAIGGLDPISIFCQTERKDLIFQVDVPEGVEVTLESETEVLNAHIQ